MAHHCIAFLSSFLSPTAQHFYATTTLHILGTPGSLLFPSHAGRHHIAHLAAATRWRSTHPVCPTRALFCSCTAAEHARVHPGIAGQEAVFHKLLTKAGHMMTFLIHCIEVLFNRDIFYKHASDITEESNGVCRPENAPRKVKLSEGNSFCLLEEILIIGDKHSSLWIGGMYSAREMAVKTQWPPTLMSGYSWLKYLLQQN
jgi:hypothetical protein